MPQSPPISVDAHDGGLVFLIGCNPERPDELSWPALATLAAADAVVHDGSASPATLALVPPRCFVEAAPADVVRVGKLAREGWRVVWLVADAPSISPATLAGAERLTETGITIRTIAGLPVGARGNAPPSAGLDVTLAPQSYATALNGLAG